MWKGCDIYELQWSYRPKTVERYPSWIYPNLPNLASMELPPEDGRKLETSKDLPPLQIRLQWSYRPKTVERNRERS